MRSISRVAVLFLSTLTFGAVSQADSVRDDSISALASKTVKYRIDVPGGNFAGKNDPGFTDSMSDGYMSKPVLVVTGSGQRLLAYNDSNSNGRVAVLNNNFKIEREIVKLTNRRIQDAIADENSVVLLLAEFIANPKKDYVNYDLHTAHIEKYDSSGRRIFSTKIVGAVKIQAVGDQGISANFAAFNISMNQTHYATYFTTYRKWDDGVTHQSEYLAFFDRATGKRQMSEDGKYPTGFTWNVSHSFRPRFAFDGERLVMAKVGDAYPRGFVVETFPGKKQNMVVPVPPAAAGETYQEVAVSTGDVHGRNGNAWVAFDSAIGRSSYDIGLLRMQDGTPGKTIWLTNSPSTRERIPRITSYGKNLLLLWGVDSGKDKWFPQNADIQLQCAIVNESGAVISAPKNFGAKGEFKMRGEARFFEIPNVGVGWVNDVTGSADQLEVVLIPYDGATVETPTQVTPSQVTINPELNYPLLGAIFDGDDSSALSLLSQGADPNAAHGDWTALLYAANFGRTSVVQDLLKRKADPNATISGWTALKLAESGTFTEIVTMLKPVTTTRARAINSEKPNVPTREIIQPSSRAARQMPETDLLGKPMKHGPGN